MRHLRYLLTAAIIIFAQSAKADWLLDFVRISCIPEARFLQIEYAPLIGSSALLDAELDGKLRRQRMNVWRKNGFYSPKKLSYECKLPESVYKITSTQGDAQERGMCGGAPKIILTLTKDGQKLFDQVVFGWDCFGNPSVSSAKISDGLAGWDSRNMVLCISPKGEIPRSYGGALTTPEICKFLSETYSDISKLVPITQEKIESISNEKAR